MSANITSSELPTRIEKLLVERQERASEIARIDAILESVFSALGATGSITVAKRGPGRPAGTATSTVTAAAPITTKSKRGGGRRNRGNYATTGDESVLAFIKARRNPTTKDIKAHWSSEGRGGTADNVLSKLFRENKVRRQKLPNERGSRYALA